MTIKVDREVMLKLLQQSNHNVAILKNYYTIAKEHWCETVEVNGIGQAGMVSITLNREKVDTPPLGKGESYE